MAVGQVLKTMPRLLQWRPGTSSHTRHLVRTIRSRVTHQHHIMMSIDPTAYMAFWSTRGPNRSLSVNPVSKSNCGASGYCSWYPRRTTQNTPLGRSKINPPCIESLVHRASRPTTIRRLVLALSREIIDRVLGLNPDGGRDGNGVSAGRKMGLNPAPSSNDSSSPSCSCSSSACRLFWLSM
jgi:hypothetical protein